MYCDVRIRRKQFSWSHKLHPCSFAIHGVYVTAPVSMLRTSEQTGQKRCKITPNLANLVLNVVSPLKSIVSHCLYAGDFFFIPDNFIVLTNIAIPTVSTLVRSVLAPENTMKCKPWPGRECCSAWHSAWPAPVSWPTPPRVCSRPLWFVPGELQIEIWHHPPNATLWRKLQ